MHHYAFIALDLARERQAEANAHRRALEARGPKSGEPSVVRRGLARAFAASGRASIGIARRLDSVATR